MPSSSCILLTEVAIIMPQRDVIITGHKNKHSSSASKEAHGKTKLKSEKYGSLVKSIQLYNLGVRKVGNCNKSPLLLKPQLFYNFRF